MPRGGSRSGAGRKSTWNYAETVVIRVPVRFQHQLLEIAHCLDQGGDAIVVPKKLPKKQKQKKVSASSVFQLDLF